MAEPLLRVQDLCKRFGALPAADNIDLELQAGEIHAVIGPNGAGKTTLIGQLAGEIAPDGGRILLHGKDIGGLGVAARARMGMSRSFQTTSLFPAFSVQDNALLAVLATRKHCFRLWRPARRDPVLVLEARAVLDEVGLGERAAVTVAELAHGERRQLEYAMALASSPSVLLLDEPMAGMGPEDSARMVELLQARRGQVAMLLVEHDMDAVFALADRVTVLVYGRVIASGSSASVRADPQVRRAYLGEDA